MKKFLTVLLALVIAFTMIVPAPASAAAPSVRIPTFSIVRVVPDQSVTIRTSQFPANDSFRVMMGWMGSRGRNGIRVARIDTGAGGSFTATFDIPEELYGEYQIAIRLESTSGSGYFAYNWFYNSGGRYGTGGPYSDNQPIGWSNGIPTFSIKNVVADESVTIRTRNFPKNERFAVLMGYMGTAGVRGWRVETINSGDGGVFEATFGIPAELQGEYQIAIRLESRSGSGYYAYNWFYNNTAGAKYGTGGPYEDPAPIQYRWNWGYQGYPTFSVIGVTRNKTITIRAYNLPAREEFEVLMGRVGSAAVNGIVVDTISTKKGGTRTYELTIPEELAGARRIAVRIESVSGSGLFAYNWFYNSNY